MALQVRRTEGLEEKRAAADVTPLRHEWSKRLGYILSRDYGRVAFQELDRESSDGTDQPIWHYYELTYQGVEYGPHEMSLGELAASVVLGALRSAQRGDIVLLDEPENFLSPKARHRLLDVIVEQAVLKRLSVVVASHSAEIIRWLPTTSIRTIERGPIGAVISEAVIPSHATRALGLDLRPDAVLFVEDSFAGHLLKAILARLLPSLHRDVQIVTVHGEGEVTHVTKVLWCHDVGIRVLGVLDGDCRARPEHQQDYLAFLPGNTCPEDVVLDTLSQPATEAATVLGVPEQELKKALRSAEGTDIHDRLEAIGRVIGVHVSDLISYAVRWLARHPDYQPDLQSLCKRIEDVLLTNRQEPD